MPLDTAPPTYQSDVALGVRHRQRTIDDVGRAVALVTGKGRVDVSLLWTQLNKAFEASEQELGGTMTGLEGIFEEMGGLGGGLSDMFAADDGELGVAD